MCCVVVVVVVVVVVMDVLCCCGGGGGGGCHGCVVGGACCVKVNDTNSYLKHVSCQLSMVVLQQWQQQSKVKMLTKGWAEADGQVFQTLLGVWDDGGVHDEHA